MKYFVRNEKRLQEVEASFKAEGYTLVGREAECSCGSCHSLSVLTEDEELDIEILVCESCYQAAGTGQRL
jgi:hypothetical protein